MILLALAIGAVLIVAAIRNSQGALASALIADVPAFVIWAAALVAVGAIGFVPGLKPVSRGLLALVIVVLILNNWTAIQAGLTAAAGDTSTAATNQAAGIGAQAGAAAGSVLGGGNAGGVLFGVQAGTTAGQLLAMIPNPDASINADLLNAANSGGTPGA